MLFYVKKGSAKPNGNLPLMCCITVDAEVEFKNIMLELIDIKKRYGSKEVLHGISIKFENGIYGLIGGALRSLGKNLFPGF